MAFAMQLRTSHRRSPPHHRRDDLCILACAGALRHTLFHWFVHPLNLIYTELFAAPPFFVIWHYLLLSSGPPQGADHVDIVAVDDAIAPVGIIDAIADHAPPVANPQPSRARTSTTALAPHTAAKRPKRAKSLV